MEPSLQEFEFLDLSEIKPEERTFLHKVLFTPDPSKKSPELPWDNLPDESHSTAEEWASSSSCGEIANGPAVSDVSSSELSSVPVELQATALVEAQPVLQSDSSTQVPGVNMYAPPQPQAVLTMPPTNNTMPAQVTTIYQQIVPPMQSSVYVNNVTANVNVHGFPIGYQTLAPHQFSAEVPTIYPDKPDMNRMGEPVIKNGVNGQSNRRKYMKSKRDMNHYGKSSQDMNAQDRTSLDPSAGGGSPLVQPAYNAQYMTPHYSPGPLHSPAAGPIPVAGHHYIAQTPYYHATPTHHTPTHPTAQHATGHPLYLPHPIYQQMFSYAPIPTHPAAGVYSSPQMGNSGSSTITTDTQSVPLQVSSECSSSVVMVATPQANTLVAPEQLVHSVSSPSFEAETLTSPNSQTVEVEAAVQVTEVNSEVELHSHSKEKTDTVADEQDEVPHDKVEQPQIPPSNYEPVNSVNIKVIAPSTLEVNTSDSSSVNKSNDTSEEVKLVVTSPTVDKIVNNSPASNVDPFPTVGYPTTSPVNSHNGPEPCTPPVSTPAGGKSWASLFKPPGSQPETKPLARVNPFINQSQEKNESGGRLVAGVSSLPASESMVDDPSVYKLAEFLHKYQLDHKAVTLQPRGLTNRSNWCYINSTLQALLACPPFFNLMKALPVTPSKGSRKSTPIIDGIVKFVNEFQPLPPINRLPRKEKVLRSKDEGQVDIQPGPIFEPTYIYKMLSNIQSDTFKVEGRQEDAEEFLSCLLNGLNDEMLELIKLVEDSASKNNLSNGDMATNGEAYPPSQDEDETEWKVMGPKNKGCVTRRADFGRSPISDIFRGQLRSRVQRAGDQPTDNVQPFFTLQLDIEKAQSVREALEILVGRDQLEGVTCSRTNQEIEAWQQVSLEELPLVLVLHLKWFDYKLDTCSKICKTVEFPIDLKVDPKLVSSNKKFGPKQKQYKLFAVVYHDGKEATKGHYITDVYHAGYGGWVRYDDSVVKTVLESQVLKPRVPRVPYLLYYRRGDTLVGTS